MAQRDLQSLVDGFADFLRRPVGVDDAQFRSLAYSPHLEDADPVRLASILRRQAPTEVRSWLIDELRVHQASGVVRVPANPALGMAQRICVPIRFDELLLGYLWLIDGEPPITEEQVRRAAHVAAEASEILYSERFLEHADRQREEKLLKELFGDDPAAREAAARQLQAAGFITRSTGYAAATVTAVPHTRLADDAVRVRLAAAADRARRSTSSRSALTVVGQDGIAVLIAEATDTVAEALSVLGRDALEDCADVRAAVGVGDPVVDLAAAKRSLRQAGVAAAVAARTGAPLCRWDALGSYQVLGSIEPEPWTWSVLLPLLSSGSGELVTTLETYLDHGGNSARTASELHLHRTTLYHRLRQAERVCGVDLGSGEDRLILHMALRLWRLAGQPEPIG